MRPGSKIVLAVVLAIVAGAAIWLLTCSKCALPPVPPTVEAPKPPLPEDIVGERMGDTNYVAALKGLIDERSEVIAEAKTVRQQMESILETAAAAMPPVDANGAADITNSLAEPTPIAEVPVAATNQAVVSTNTALRAGTEVNALPTPPTADLGGIPPALLEHVRQQTEWVELEARLNALAARQQEIQINTKTLIRERMEAQYAARAAEQTAPLITSPERIIKLQTNAPDFNQTEITVITNVPAGGMQQPPRPDRRPVEVKP